MVAVALPHRGRARQNRDSAPYRSDVALPFSNCPRRALGPFGDARMPMWVPSARRGGPCGLKSVVVDRLEKPRLSLGEVAAFVLHRRPARFFIRVVGHRRCGSGCAAGLGPFETYLSAARSSAAHGERTLRIAAPGPA